MRSRHGDQSLLLFRLIRLKKGWVAIDMWTHKLYNYNKQLVLCLSTHNSPYTLTTLQGTLLLSRHDIPYKILPRSGMLPKIPIRGLHPTTWRSGISHLLKFAVTWSHHLLHLSCRSLWLQVSELRQWTLKPIQTWRQFLLFPIVPRTSNQFVLAHTHGGCTKSAWGSCRRPTSPNGSLSKCANSERKWRRVHCGP